MNITPLFSSAANMMRYAASLRHYADSHISMLTLRHADTPLIITSYFAIS